ncbi:short-chain fatty acyl-CoA regulator family protein [Rhizobium sp. YIM 134829]|uniref:helix-turn-helix domain-containing protein n=1 Tax=Rhizobium sp. YIM 134829 TaxID=3390453 RepID=UPI00397A0FF3
MDKQGVYLGPRLRRLRKDLGLTQANMASDLEVSPSYIALMEGNQRPVTAEILLRLARTYKLDMASLADDSLPDLVARLQAALKDPLFADIDIAPLEAADVLTSFPGFGEALLRLHTAYREGQFALADRRQAAAEGGGEDLADPVAAVRSFLAARHNCFPALDSAAERLAGVVAEAGGLVAYLSSRHALRVRRLPASVMIGSKRRLDRHRREVLLEETLDGASQAFQLAQQIAYLEMDEEIDRLVREAVLPTESGRRLAHRALAGFFAAAVLMPYTAFSRAVEARRYDIEALSRQFSTSFEQTAHRLTTLQKPGQERIPFFFIRVDAAGNVSKRLDSAGFPFARHGGGCPLWSLHQVFSTPRRLVTQWLELPDGQRFFSIARTVSAGGGAYGVATVERAVALVCEGSQAERLVYHQPGQPVVPTPIGISCRLCQREHCTARSQPPIGRQILPDHYRQTEAPFGFSD